MIRRRPTQVFSLAFLDCICCGFGAIILIFVLSVDTQDRAKQETLAQLRRSMAADMEKLKALRQSKEDLERSNARVATMVVDQRLKNDSLHALLDELEAKLANEKKGQQALMVDIDELKKEIAARQKKAEVVLKDIKPTPVGVPVGSNYIAFVIDTSGSMRDPNTGELWPIVVRKIDEVLDSYPTLEGIQVLDSDGRFIMAGGGRGAQQWMADSPEVRAAIKRAVRRYDEFAYSNPVPGIARALNVLQEPNNQNMRMGIYIFGDEFADNEKADVALRRLDQLNPADENGHRRVVINAVGFPTTIRFEFSMANTGLRYANLMRELTYEHGGAFIALQDL
jgi:hypothetical protein